MFLLLGFGYISLMQWYRRHLKLRLYISAVRQVVDSCSVVVSKIQRPSASLTQTYYRASPFFMYPASEKRTWTPLVEDELIVMLASAPKVEVCLLSWSLYGDCMKGGCPHEIFVLLETDSPVTDIPYLQSQEIMKHSIAWKSEALTGVVVGCDLQNFISMCEQFGAGSLMVDKHSDLQRLLTVDVKWPPDPSPLSTLTRSCNIKQIIKPPNILVYCGKVDSVRQFESIKKTLGACITSDSYTLYHLNHDQVKSIPWQTNTLLLILACHCLPVEMEETFLHFLNNGGCVLSFGTSLEDKFLLTKEVKYHDGLTTFSMLRKWENVKCLRGQYNYEVKKSVRSDVSLTVLAWDSVYDEAVVVGIDSNPQCKPGMGRAVFSQLFLHKDPMECATNQDTFDQLKKNNSSRIEILQHILSWLGVDCHPSEGTSLTAASLLTATEDLKTAFLSSVEKRLKGRCLKSRFVTLEFLQSNCNISSLNITASHLPVLCTDILHHNYFQQQVYWQNLDTSVLGRVVIYTDVLPTTMTLLEGLQFSVPDTPGLVAIAGRQTTGKGRGGNTWLSPKGCAMFSLLVRIPVSSNLGERVSFLQHITSLAVVYSITTLPGYEMLDLKLKWPNDIYYSNKMKLGGVLVSSTVMGSTIYAVIGCGFNVMNSNPTICVNDIIAQYNKQHGTRLPVCSVEKLIGRTITQIETLITDFQTHGHQHFCQQYYTVWLHSESRVQLESEGGQDVTITGLDDFGFLEVLTQDGNSLSVQPDGNTFDMMHNLICRKTTK